MSLDGWLKCRNCNEPFIPPEERADYTGDGLCLECKECTMTIPTGGSITAAAIVFADTFANTDNLSDEIGPEMTCTEVDALASVLWVTGHRGAAAEWIRGHAESESNEDDCDHYGQDPVEYANEHL